MKINSLDKIAELLPEGLDDDLLNKIADLVGNKITEEVQAKVEDLSIKVRAFIRGQIDSLKEQAIKELELENETFRSAQLFESMKSVFVSELTEDDEITATNLMAMEAEGLSKDKLVLAGELDKQLKENMKLENVVKTLTRKVSLLEGKLEEQKTLVTESTGAEEMKLSDTALMVSVENFQRKGSQLQVDRSAPKKTGSGNVFLTEEILNLM